MPRTVGWSMLTRQMAPFLSSGLTLSLHLSDMCHESFRQLAAMDGQTKRSQLRV